MQKQVIKLPLGLSLFRALPLPRKLGILEKIYGRYLGKQGIQRVKTSNGVIWKLDLSEVTHRWIVYGDYEGSAQLGWIRNWLAQGGLVVDSGANIGQMLLFVAPLPGVRVLAFEPVSGNYAWLRDCLLNYPSWDVKLIQQGLYNENTELTFQIDGGRSTSRLDWYQGKDLRQESLQVVRLDGILEPDERVRLWKLDVEGAELDALAGAEKLFAERRIDAVLVEVCRDHFPALKEFMVKFGYRLFVMNSRGHIISAPQSVQATTNMIALHD